MGKIGKTRKPIRHIIQFKYRLLSVILAMATLLLTISFFAIYNIFVTEFEKQTQKITLKVFSQTEESIHSQLAAAEKSTNELFATKAVSEFFYRPYTSPLDKAEREVKVIAAMDSVIGSKSSIFSLAFINNNGRILGSTLWRTCAQKLSDQPKLSSLLNQVEFDNIYMKWFSSDFVKENLIGVEAKEVFAGKPTMIGVRAVQSSISNKQNIGYAIVCVYESAINELYSQVLYNDSRALICNKDGRIISSANCYGNNNNNNSTNLGEEVPYFNLINKEIGSQTFRWSDDNKYQIICYPLKEYGWYLINEIPYKAFTAQAETIKFWVITVCGITLSMMAIFFIFWIFRYTKPIEALILRMKEVEQGDLTDKPLKISGIAELDAAAIQLKNMTKELSSSIEHIHAAEEEKRIEELKTLQYQINPHFLYNSLNSIRWMAMMSNAPHVGDALVTLVKIITPILKSPSFFWEIKDEIEFVDNYIKMMSLRYGSNLQFELLCDTSLYGIKFPRFVLQPLIENCFAHGFKSGNNIFKIDVSIVCEDDVLTIYVKDNGNGIEKDSLEQLNKSLHSLEENNSADGSIGLRNVNKRLFLLYPNRAGLVIFSENGEGTNVVIKISQSDKPIP